MKVFIPILCLMSLALAEPPVGDGYPSSHSSHDDHYNDHQRSLSQEYGPPSDTSSARNAISNSGYEYNKPGARSSSNTRGRSQFAPPTVRVSFNQRFSSTATTAARNSAQGHADSNARSLSQGYSAPNARSEISQEYGPPARSLSQEYGVPAVVSARTLSTEYGVPDARSAPSLEYGAPVVAARSSQNSHSEASAFRSALPASSQDYSLPAARSHSDSLSNGYSTPSSRSNVGAQSYASRSTSSSFNSRSVQSSRASAQDHSPPAARSQLSSSLSHGSSGSLARSNGATQGYDSSKTLGGSSFGRSTPSSTYSAPSSRSSSAYTASSARNSESQHQNTVAQTFGAPSEKDVSETYGAPNARSLSQEYGVPSSRANEMTDAVVSSYASARSSPSSTYLPASRDAAPSEQYGVPEQRDGASQGYDYARARALEEELKNQEPASYDFGYQIEDQESGSDFGHTETREEDRAQGSYFVVLPDGTKQTVDYEADERGFKPRISVEPAAGGYDDNAAEIGRTAGGPY